MASIHPPIGGPQPARKGRRAARRSWCAILVAAGLVAMTVPALGNHPQAQSGQTVTFDHRAGNEWWIEVQISGTVSTVGWGVYVRDDGGPWILMESPSWAPNQGYYAKSFHIEPGHRVEFKITQGSTVIQSCPFTHPAGVEQCPTTSNPWTVRPVGDGGSPAGTDLAIGDADGDGRNELYLAGGAGLQRYEWTSAGWTRTTVHHWHGMQDVAVGDVTGDGQADLIAAGVDGNGESAVYRFAWDGQAWEANFVDHSAESTTIGDLRIADLEDDGQADIYYGVTSFDRTITQVELSGGSGSVRELASLPIGVMAMASGDADNDGDIDLYLGGEQSDGTADAWSLDATPSTGETYLIHDAGQGQFTALAVADANRDGQRELFGAIRSPGNVGRLMMHSGESLWTATDLPALPGDIPILDLAAGDADNDGDEDLYASGQDGRIYRIHWTGSAWAVADLAAASAFGGGVVVGDGDGDGVRELYHAGSAAACCGNPVVQVMDHPVPARPPAPWHESLIGEAGGRSSESDIAIGDGDRDGRREVYVAARAGLFQFEWTGSAWQKTILSNGLFHRVAVGDGDRDGTAEVYASGAALNGGYELRRFSVAAGGGWTSSQVHASTVPVGTLTLGDVDDDGTREVYIAMVPEFGGDIGSMPSYQLEFEGGGWQIRYIANLEGGARSSWIGDADRDGDRDLYVVGARVHRLDITAAGVGSVALIGGDLAGEDNWFNGIVAGDGDGDGLSEVYVGAGRFHDATDAIYRYAPRTGGWERSAIALPQGVLPYDLALSDGDNDGTAELYFSGWDGGLWQLRWTGSAWALKKLADIGSEFGINLAMGDADGDGKAEAYMTAYDASRSPPENVYRLGTVAPPQSFDATFTGVQGNEWWIQAGVTASGGTLAKVDARINGGAWKPLAKQSWGGWAASHQAVQGTTVQLRATSGAGVTDLSDCYRWIPASGQDAAKVTCGTVTPPPPPPPGFDATFSGVKGNDWWVQASVSANQAIQGVDARVNCAAAWKPLAKQDWGGWAASFNVPAGSKVDFRARSTAGSSDLSGGYTWPQATATTACP